MVEVEIEIEVEVEVEINEAILNVMTLKCWIFEV